MGADFPPFVLAIVTLNLTEERKKLLSVFVVPKYKKKKHGSDNSKIHHCVEQNESKGRRQINKLLK